MQEIRLIIISRSQSFRRSLASLFTIHEGFNVVGEIDSATNTEHLMSIQPDVVIYGIDDDLDENIRDNMKNVKELCPFTLLIAFSCSSDNMQSTFLSGADGYLKAPILPTDLVTAIELACRSGICLFPREGKELLTVFRVLKKKLNGNGKSDEAIAQ